MVILSNNTRHYMMLTQGENISFPDFWKAVYVRWTRNGTGWTQFLLIKHYGLTYFYSYWLRYPIVDFKWIFIANDSYCLREKLGVRDYLMGKKVGA